MKKIIALLIIVAPLLFAFQNGDESDARKRIPGGCTLRSSVSTKGVSLLQTKCQFTFKTTSGATITDSIRYSHNGVNGVLRPDKNGIATVILPYGTTRFQFLYTTSYFEIYSDTINLKGGHMAKFDVDFEDANTQIICDKPVIYVYPDETKQVNIQLNVLGELGFTYPHYNIPGNNDSATNGWTFTADPDGSLHVNGKDYDYLFWDAKVPASQFNQTISSGFFVNRDSLVPFFERNLTKMGLNAREQQDFITYWVPIMNKNESSFVHFMFTEEYDNIATINISPKPDHLFRVFMAWGDADAFDYGEVNEQEIPFVTREGFTVIEWGGGEIPSNWNPKESSN
jgi:hypothetical protein